MKSIIKEDKHYIQTHTSPPTCVLLTPLPSLQPPPQTSYHPPRIPPPFFPINSSYLSKILLVAFCCTSTPSDPPSSAHKFTSPNQNPSNLSDPPPSGPSHNTIAQITKDVTNEPRNATPLTRIYSYLSGRLLKDPDPGAEPSEGSRIELTAFLGWSFCLLEGTLNIRYVRGGREDLLIS